MRKLRLGEILRDAGAVSLEDLDEAIEEQKDRSILLGELLLQKQLVAKDQLASALERITGILYLDCHRIRPEPQALDLLPREVALRYNCLPIAFDGREIVLVMSEPQNLHHLDELRFITGLKISPRLAFSADVRKAIARHYNDGRGDLPSEADVEISAFAADTDRSEIEFFTASSRQQAKDAIKEFQAALRSKYTTPAVRLVSSIISTAIQKKASDLHIDPQANNTIIRLRVDGILRDLVEAPAGLASQLVSRIKILADLDIAEKRAPQDGRLLVRLDQRKLDLRVSTLPTHYGEKVVMRLLDPDSARLSFRELGFSAEHAQALAQTFSAPQGLVLVCGPTGSGKTTTLYAALNQLSERSVNIITVEDPIEYMLEGINQVQVNTKAGLTFAKCLRSILRQDPNIVLVGEIRDRETAEIALTAAQTGHLVLSTLHTNDSIAALDRLRDLGIPEFLIATSVSAIISQRLLRKLCSCRAIEDQPERYAELLPESGYFDLSAVSYRPSGCPACDRTGYKGRIGAFEVFLMENEIRRMIQNGAGTDEIRTQAASAGLQSMRDDAMEKAKRGLTSLDEVFRVVPITERPSLVCKNCQNELLSNFAFCPACGSPTQQPSRIDKRHARQGLPV